MRRAGTPTTGVPETSRSPAPPERSDPAAWEEMLPSAAWPRRREALRELFEAIAPTYDRLNHWMSFGIDRRWRARAAREAVSGRDAAVVLDLASGTGDQASALQRCSRGVHLVRLDLSGALLRRGEEKLRPGSSAPALVGEMERLPLRPETFDAVTMAFALRHVESLERLMEACARILRPGGIVSFVDMSIPERGVWGALYRFYFRQVLPRFAALLGGPRPAYELMVRSVESFPGWDRLDAAAREAGFRQTRVIRLTGGAASIFVARRP
jgi:demethylmenaquinone methyltransferase / 2-methoxy-6-polyprenyl-1,4-benzoquinol methylase